MKKLSRPFQSIIHAKRTYRELRLLKHMKHENVSGLGSLLAFPRSKPAQKANAYPLVKFNEMFISVKVVHSALCDFNLNVAFFFSLFAGYWPLRCFHSCYKPERIQRCVSFFGSGNFLDPFVKRCMYTLTRVNVIQPLVS